MFTYEKNFDTGMKFYHRSILLFTFLLSLLLTCAVSAQSTNQNSPTPVTSGEISGTIRPRDLGDSRLTSYYFQFDGAQGDLFINVVTNNFTGDIDVFTQTGLRPLTKIVIYADFAASETGRVLYLRKPEKMILRVQGRTPGDDAATFRVKFAGSFLASTQPEPVGEPALPTIAAKNESGIRVNSVGTIVEIIPKATPTAVPLENVRDRSTASEADKAKAENRSEENPTGPEKRVEVVVTENVPEKTAVPSGRRRNTRGRPTPSPTSPPAEPSTGAATAKAPVRTPPAATGRRGREPAKTTAKEPDPLANINLVIVFKDGTTIQRPMSEVLRFTVDKGVLTVISKDGTIGRYSVLDVAKLTIQ